MEGKNKRLNKLYKGKVRKMATKVRIDDDECIGCESCVELCPDVFRFNGDTDKAEVIDEDMGGEECVEEAVASCPAECIHVDE